MKPKSTHAAAHSGYAGEGSRSPSPPPSPRLQSTLSHCRRAVVRSKTRRDASVAVTLLRRSLRYSLLLLPLLYVLFVITCSCPFPAIMGLYPPLPGSLYRSHLIFENLWDDIRFDNSSRPIEVCL